MTNPSAEERANFIASLDFTDISEIRSDDEVISYDLSINADRLYAAMLKQIKQAEEVAYKRGFEEAANKVLDALITRLLPHRHGKMCDGHNLYENIIAHIGQLRAMQPEGK